MYFLFSAFLSAVHNTLYYRTQYSVPSFKVLRTEIMNRIEVLYAASLIERLSLYPLGTCRIK